MQKKPTMKYHLTLFVWLLLKGKITSAGMDVEKREPLCTVGINVNWWSDYGKQYEGSSKKLKKNNPTTQQFYF